MDSSDSPLSVVPAELLVGLQIKHNMLLSTRVDIKNAAPQEKMKDDLLFRPVI